MESNDKQLNLFTTRMRQLILKFQELKQENRGLYAMIEEQENAISQLKQEIESAHKDYDNLRMAKMLSASEGGVEEAKLKVQRVIRSIDKCIALLNDKA